MGQYKLNLCQQDNGYQEIIVYVDANELGSFKYVYVAGGKKEKNHSRNLKVKDSKILNNKIVKYDKDLDFELKVSQITDNILIGPYVDDEK